MSNPTTIEPKKRTLIFINIIITCIASSMLATALTTALPSMIQDFQITLTTGQWLTSGYSLAMGIMMPLTAFLINRFPTRNLYHLQEPFLELRILKNKEYALSVIGSMLVYLIMMGSSVILPLYVQTIMGYSATVSGILSSATEKMRRYMG